MSCDNVHSANTNTAMCGGFPTTSPIQPTTRVSTTVMNEPRVTQLLYETTERAIVVSNTAAYQPASDVTTMAPMTDTGSDDTSTGINDVNEHTLLFNTTQINNWEVATDESNLNLTLVINETMTFELNETRPVESQVDSNRSLQLTVTETPENSSYVDTTISLMYNRTESSDGDTYARHITVAETRPIDGTVSTTETQSLDGTTRTPEAQSLEGSVSTTKTRPIDGTTSTTEAQSLDGTVSTTETRPIAGTASTTEAHSLEGSVSTTETQPLDGTASTTEAQPLDGTLSTTETQSVDDTASTTETQSLDGTTSATQTQSLDGTTSTTETQSLDGTASATETQSLDGTASTTETQSLDGTASTTETHSLDGTTSATQTQSLDGTTSTTETQSLDGTASTTQTQSLDGTDDVTENALLRNHELNMNKVTEVQSTRDVPELWNLMLNMKELASRETSLYVGYCHNVSSELSVGASTRGAFNRCNKAGSMVQAVLTEPVIKHLTVHDHICSTVQSMDELISQIDNCQIVLHNSIMSFVNEAGLCDAENPCRCADVMMSRETTRHEMNLLCSAISNPVFIESRIRNTRISIQVLKETLQCSYTVESPEVTSRPHVELHNKESIKYYTVYLYNNIQEILNEAVTIVTALV